MNLLVVTSLLPPLAVFVPLLGAILVIPLSRRSQRARAGGVVATTVVTAALVLSMVPGALGGTSYEAYVLKMAPSIWMHFRTDALGMLFASAAVVLWILVAVYSLGYMADEHRLDRYYIFFLLSLGWTLGVALAANLLTLLIFYELFSILTYPLIVHEETPEALAAGTKYIVYILVGGSLVVLAIVLTFSLAGTDSLAHSGVFGPGVARTTLVAVFWCFIAGFGVKAALVPLHGWVPDAHPAAPAPFSALLSGVMVAAGSFSIARAIFNVFGVALVKSLGVLDILSWIAAFTVVLAGILALNQDNLKRRLAYSTISQMAYVILGLSLINGLAIEGALTQIANHAFMKGTLFLCAGIIIKKTGFHRVSEMAGLARRLPVTAAALTVATLAMIGTPPLAGFVSKWYLGLGMVQSRHVPYLVILLGGALLAAGYLLPIVYTMYFKEPAGAEVRDEKATEPEAPLTMLVPTVAGAAMTVLLGLFAWVPGLPLSLAKLAAGAFLK